MSLSPVSPGQDVVLVGHALPKVSYSVGDIVRVRVALRV